MNEWHSLTSRANSVKALLAASKITQIIQRHRRVVLETASLGQTVSRQAALKVRHGLETLGSLGASDLKPVLLAVLLFKLCIFALFHQENIIDTKTCRLSTSNQTSCSLLTPSARPLECSWIKARVTFR